LPLAADSSSASSTVAESRTRPSVRPRRRNESLLGGENAGRGEQLGSDTFYDEVERKLCPGFEGFGRNLSAFNDVLRGGFSLFD
jgi:hypothetical protein